MADLIGVSNLYSYGQSYANYVGSRFILGLNESAPRLPSPWAFWIKVYGLLAALYRPLTIAGMLTVAATLFQGAGVVISFAGITMFLVLPCWRLIKRLSTIHATGDLLRTKLAIRVGLILLTVLATTWFIPTTWNGAVPAIVQYDPPSVLRARTSGFVETIHFRSGENVEIGQTIITLAHDELRLRLSELKKSVAQLERKIASAHWRADSSELTSARLEQKGMLEQLNELELQVENLEVRSTSSGKLVARGLERMLGTFVRAGTEFGLVGNEEKKRLMCSIRPQDAEAIGNSKSNMVRVFAPSTPAFNVQLERVESRASRTIADDSLLVLNGGSLSFSRAQDQTYNLVEPRLNSYAALSVQQSQSLHVGQRAYVHLGTRPPTIGNEIINSVRGLLRTW